MSSEPSRPRPGLEDNIRFDKSRLARSNVDLVRGSCAAYAVMIMADLPG